MKKIVELLRLCNTPASIISPYPFFAIAIFLISQNDYKNINSLFLGIIVTLLSNYASNLWNHCNDLKEDIAQGKKTILTQDISIQKIAIIFSVMLYAISI